MKMFSGKLKLVLQSLVIVLAMNFITEALFAQEFSFSRPQKMSQRAAGYELLGKTSSGFLVYYYGERYHEIESFNLNDLSSRWKLEIPLIDKKSEVVEVVATKDELIVFYVDKNKSERRLKAVKFSSNLTNPSTPITIHTYQKKFGSFGFDYKVHNDLKKKKFVVQVLRNGTPGYSEAKCYLLNRELTIEAELELDLSNDWKYKSTVVDRSGAFCLATHQVEKKLLGRRNKVDKIKLFLVSGTGQTDEVTLNLEGLFLGDYDIELDRLNGNIVVSGFYAENQFNDVEGYFLRRVNLRSGTVEAELERSFFSQPGNNIQLRSISKRSSSIENLRLRRIIVRSDGGAILIGEVRFKSSRNDRSPSLAIGTPIQGSRTETYNVNETLLLSVDPDGVLRWAKVLQKEQYSENDGAYYSSYGLFQHKSELHLIFNEEVDFDTIISDYVVKANGEHKVRGILRTGDYKVLLALRYAKQVSSKTLIVPAFNERNEFILAKLSQ